MARVHTPAGSAELNGTGRVQHHGEPRENFHFRCYPEKLDFKATYIVRNPQHDTLMSADQYCTNCKFVCACASGAKVYECLGHDIITRNATEKKSLDCLARGKLAKSIADAETKSPQLTAPIEETTGRLAQLKEDVKAYQNDRAAATLKKLVSQINMMDSDRESIMAFLYDSSAYAPASGEIVGIFMTMSDEMSKDLADTTVVEKAELRHMESS